MTSHVLALSVNNKSVVGGGRAESVSSAGGAHTNQFSTRVASVDPGVE